MKTKQVIILFVLFFSILNFVSATDEPTLVKVTDSLGNIQTNSWAKGTGESWNPECSNCIIQIGDKIKFTMTANQENLEYRCHDSDWSTSNTCEWIVQKEDYGPRTSISFWIRNANGLDYRGNGNGDDSTRMAYRVDVNDSPIITDSSEKLYVPYITVNVPLEAFAGDIIALDVVLTNEGTDTFDNSFVTATISELGVQKKAYFGNLFNNESRRIYLTIPSNAPTGVYQIEISVSDYDVNSTILKNIAITGLNISNSTSTTIDVTEKSSGLENKGTNLEHGNFIQKIVIGVLVILLLIAIGYIIYPKNRKK